MEELIYRSSEFYNKSYRVSEESAVGYIDKRTFAKLFPKEAGGFQVVGVVTKKEEQSIGYLTIGEAKLYYRGMHYNRNTQEIKGYIQVGDTSYVGILGSTLWKKFLLLFLVLCGLVGGYFGYQYYLENQPESIPLDGDIAVYERPENIPENYDPDYITIPGYGELKMEADTDVLYVALWNPEENPCYFQFAIRLEETGEVLYESGLIPPEYAVTEVTLNRTLEQGIHDVVISITTYDIDDYTIQLNGGEVVTTIVAIAP